MHAYLDKIQNGEALEVLMSRQFSNKLFESCFVTASCIEIVIVSAKMIFDDES